MASYLATPGLFKSSLHDPRWIGERAHTGGATFDHPEFEELETRDGDDSG